MNRTCSVKGFEMNFDVLPSRLLKENCLYAKFDWFLPVFVENNERIFT